MGNMELETGKKLRTGAVIVAAGHKSKNSVFKPLLPVGDSTAIRRIIITLKRAGVSPIVVVTGDKADELEKHISNLQVICLRNEQYAVTQMFSSICMGLNYIEDLCDRVFVLPAKFPVFLRETVQRLMQMWSVPCLTATEVILFLFLLLYFPLLYLIREVMV